MRFKKALKDFTRANVRVTEMLAVGWERSDLPAEMCVISYYPPYGGLSNTSKYLRNPPAGRRVGGIKEISPQLGCGLTVGRYGIQKRILTGA